jgi:hypothetical protein
MSAKNGTTRKTKASLFATTGTPTGVAGFDWGSQEASRIVGIVQLVTGRGGAIRFGYTRDGSSGSIGLYYGDQRDTLYITPNTDAEDVFGLIERTFENFPMTNGASPK